jgi:hypothetical protein
MCIHRNFSAGGTFMADHSQKSASALHNFNHKPKTEYEAIIPKFLLTFSSQ